MFTGYLLCDININLQLNDKEISRNKSADTTNKEIPHLTRSYLEFYFIHFLEKIIARPTRSYTYELTLTNYRF